MHVWRDKQMIKNEIFIKVSCQSGIDIKVENSKADTVFWEGVIRPNFVLDIKTDKKKLGTIVKWGTKS
jgi:hypothetical protein